MSIIQQLKELLQLLEDREFLKEQCENGDDPIAQKILERTNSKIKELLDL